MKSWLGLVFFLCYHLNIYGVDWRDDIQQKLNWQVADNICYGSFKQDFSVDLAPKYGHNITAKNISIEDSTQTISGGVKVIWDRGQISAAAAQIINSDDGTIISAPKTVTFENTDSRLVANSAIVNIGNSSGQWLKVLYRSRLIDKSFFWGWAEKLLVDGNDYWLIYNASWSRCSVDQPLWHIEADKIELDNKQKEAKVTNGYFNLYNLPILFLPSMTFPLGNNKKTGWLMPKFSNQLYLNNTLYLPWYWNIAPNQDLMATTWYSVSSGLAAQLKWRYVGRFGLTQIRTFATINDASFARFKANTLAEHSSDPLRTTGVVNLQNADAFRWGLAVLHNYSDRQNKVAINWQLVADDDVTRHFPNAFSLLELQYLPKHLDWLRFADDYSFKLQWHDWQVLHSLLWQPMPSAYAAKPRWSGFKFYNLAKTTTVSINVDIANFVYKKLLANPTLPSGVRLVLEPKIHWHKKFIDLQAAIYLASSYLQDASVSSVAVLVPKFKLELKGGKWIHANKNPLYLLFKAAYILVPYRSQVNVPHFEMDLVLPFYNALFMQNRFSGKDWQGDTNHVAIGMELKSYNNSKESWNVAVGQGWAFSRHRLCLDQDCIGDLWAKQHPSALQLFGNYKLNDLLEIKANLAWDWYGHTELVGDLTSTLNLAMHKLRLGYMKFKVPQDEFFPSHIWNESSLQNFLLGIDSKLTNNISSRLEAHWDQVRHQIADVGFNITLQNCCSLLQLGLVRKYNESFNQKEFLFENRVYIKISLFPS